MTNAEVCARAPTTEDWIKTRLGIDTRRIAAPDQQTSDLARFASERAIESAGLVPDDAEDHSAQPPPSYRASHTVPGSGLAAWIAPDPQASPVSRLDPYLDVQLLEQRVDGWGHVRCSNGWEAWVDGRLLQAMPTSAGPPPDTT